MSAFRRFFSFSVLTYGGTGEFMDASYIKIDWKVIVGAAIAVLLMMTSGRLLKVIPPKPVKASVLAGVAAFLVGVGVIAFTHFHYFPVADTVIWGDLPGGQPEQGLPRTQRQHQRPHGQRPVPVHRPGPGPAGLPRQHHE